MTALFYYRDVLLHIQEIAFAGNLDCFQYVLLFITILKQAFSRHSSTQDVCYSLVVCHRLIRSTFLYFTIEQKVVMHLNHWPLRFDEVKYCKL